MNMYIVELKAKINSLIQFMFVEEILDGQFRRVQALQDETNPNFAIEVLGLFCDDTETMIDELTEYINQQNVDYEKMRERAHKLKGSAACIGAHHMKMASVELLQAARDKNKQGFEKAVRRLAAEYVPLRDNFLALAQIQKRILEIETSDRQEINNIQEAV